MAGMTGRGGRPQGLTRISPRQASGFCLLGFVGSTPVAAPLSGRLRGLLRSGARVRAGETVAEITAGTSAPVNVIDRAYQLIARSVAFTIDMEQQGRSIDVWNRRTGFRPAS
jgi:xanthine dehydrogenase accessory factor